MCGMCGYANTSRSLNPGKEYLSLMVDALHHRGPDGNGTHVRPGVGLGHARLSIIDIGGGAQPMTIEDGRYAITFNGEIYNYKELRRNLIAKGHQFTTESDTEVILHLYQEYGEDFLQEMNGMFALGLWDAGEERLILARDRIGEKPLYYGFSGEGIVFASELKALRQCTDLTFSLSMRAVDDYLAYGYIPAPGTIYNEIKKLPQAHYLIWDNGAVSLKRYWKVREQVRAVGDIEAVEELAEILDDSIRIRLRSDVPVGAFLSGGIDSTLITAIATKHTKDPLQSFTIGFDNDTHDEAEEAEFTARFLGTTHTTKYVDGMSLDILPDLVRQYDEPFADPSTVPTFYVTREASNHLKVCLSGDGGDELFGGYPQYQWESFEQGLNAIPTGVRRAFLSVPASMIPTHVRGYGWIERMMCDGAARYQQKIGIFNPKERYGLLREANRGLIDYNAEVLSRFFDGDRSEIEMRQTADRETYLPDDILVKVDRSSMAHSLEVRTPFLDHRLIEFSASLPHNIKIRNGEQKWVLKQLLKTVVPAEVLNRKKKGFGLPLCDWFRGAYREFVAERLLQKSNKIFEFLEPQAIERLVKNHNRGQRDFSDRIWALIWLEEWLRAFHEPSSSVSK